MKPSRDREQTRLVRVAEGFQRAASVAESLGGLISLVVTLAVALGGWAGFTGL